MGGGSEVGGVSFVLLLRLSVAMLWYTYSSSDATLFCGPHAATTSSYTPTISRSSTPNVNNSYISRLLTPAGSLFIMPLAT